MSIQSLFARQATSSTDELQEQARVRCNSDCSLKLPTGEQCIARVRDLNWYGLSLDRVPLDLIEGRHQPEIELSWTLPREFGFLDFKTKDYVASEYLDPIGDRKYLILEVVIAESELLEDIRRYLKFRNKSFIRGTQRRNRSAVSAYFLWLLWIVIFAILGLLFFSEIAKKISSFF
jgi:hypothetical protein